MSRVAAALTAGLVVSCFFQLIGFVIYVISCSSTHLYSAFFVPLQSGNSVLPKLDP